MIALVMPCSFFFFFNDTATTEIYTLSLHDALPISRHDPHRLGAAHRRQYGRWRRLVLLRGGAGRHLRHGGVVGREHGVHAAPAGRPSEAVALTKPARGISTQSGRLFAS